MPRGIMTIVTVATILAVAACDESDAVVEYIAPKDGPIQTAQAEGPRPPVRPDASSEAIHWTLPAGWARQPGSRQFRYATLETAAGERRLEVSVSMLAGDGGGLLANINRWRVEQMGLKKISADEVVDHTARLEVKDSEALLVDIESKAAEGDRRMLVGIIFRPGGTWFFKAAADSGVVAEHRADFLKLLSSVHFVAGSAALPKAPGPPQVVPGEATWTMPPGWRQDADPGRLLVTRFRVGEGSDEATVTVSHLGGQGGGLLANINRWRVQQMGLESVQRPADQPHVVLMIGGSDGRMIDLGDRTGAGKRMLVAMVPHGGFTWFFKMSGPGNVVERHRRAFDEFLESVAFEQAR